ncbi:hypothetical protein D1872_223410 [compost metagenome]
MPVDDAPLGLFIAEKDVLRDGQVGNQRKLLVDNDDTEVLALLDIFKFASLAFENNVALIGAVRVYAAEHLHQRRFAGTVLPA